MYCSFFGFQERPFTLTPNPAFIFLSRAHQEAFAHLIYGIENRCGFIMLTGEVGAGKTTVIRTLLTELKPETHATALILNPMVSSSGLLRTINREFGISDQGSEPAELVEELHRFLLSQKQAGKATVLVIDEAQDMEPEVLEQVRLVSNLETASEKLIQIILVGQPELEELLARPELRQLNQRITVRFHLTSMELADTGDYLKHRLKTAAGGASDPAVFSTGACKAIHRFAAGLPRLINAAADRALLIAYNHNSRQIDTAVAKQAITDVSRSRKETRSPARLMAWTAGVVVLLAVAALALLYLPGPLTASRPPAPDATLEQRMTGLTTGSQTDQWQTLLTALAAAWGNPPPVKRVGESPEQAIQLPWPVCLSLHRQPGRDHPAGLPCPAGRAPCPPAGVKQYLLLTGIQQERVVLTTGSDTPLELPLQRLEQYWTGKALIPWDNLADLPVPFGRDADGTQREQLARLLNAAGCAASGRNLILGCPTPCRNAAFSDPAGDQPHRHRWRTDPDAAVSLFPSDSHPLTRHNGTDPMSHILDALQKLQEEKTAHLKQSVITGGILLDAGAPRPQKTKHYLLAGMVAVALMIGVVAFWLIQRPNTQARPKTPLTEQQQLALQPPTVVTPPPAAVPPPSQTAPAAVPAVQPAASAAPAQASPDEDKEDRSNRRTRQTNVPATAAAQVSTAPVTVGTPEGVKLSGIAWHDNRKLRRAVINDLLVAEGAEVAGARIVEIRTHLVKIEKNGTLFEVVLPH